MPSFARRSCGIFCSLLCVAAVVGCGGGSPEKTFQSFSTAVKSNNFPIIWKNLAPQTRGTVLQIMVLDADALSAANNAAKDAIGQAYAKYGLNPQDANFAQARLQVTNPSGLATDLDIVFRQFQTDLAKLAESRYTKLQAIWSASSQSGLAKTQIQGARATAGLQGKIPHTADNASVQAVFEKVNGLWLLSELEENTAGPGMAGGPGGAANAAGGPGAMPGGPGTMPGGGPAAGGPGANPAGAAGAGGPGPAGAGPMPPAGAPAAPGLAADPKAMPAGPMPPAGGPAMAAGDPKAMPADPKSAAPAVGGPAMAAGDPKTKAAGDPKAMAGEAKPGNAAPGGPAMAAGGPAGDGAIAPGKLNRSEGGTQTDPNKQKIKPGSFEDAIVSFTERMASGDLSGIDYYISSKAKGVLAEIRSGEISEERLGELKSTFQNPTPQGETMKNTGAAIVITVKGGLGHSIVLTAAKEEGIFKIKDLKILEPGVTKKR